MLFIGLVNTIRVSFIAIILTTIFGLALSLLQISKILILEKISFFIIDTIKNIPVYVIIIFSFLTFNNFFTNIINPVVIIENVLIISRSGITIPWIFEFVVSYPELARFGITGGLDITPEFISLTLGLSIYTSAFVADIFSSAIRSFPKDFRDSASSLNFTKYQTLFFIVIPYSFRIISPSLVNQYINLLKNSSLGVGIGYPELLTVTQLSINTTGKTVEAISIMALIYFILSYFTSLFLNYTTNKSKI